VDTLKLLGVTASIVPTVGVLDGINAVRRVFDRFWFDAVKAKTLVEALSLYRRDFDEKNKTFRTKPLHDWTSHLADAARYLAVGIPSSPAKNLPIDRYRRDKGRSGPQSFMGV
jgi:phage terminase large subunit